MACATDVGGQRGPPDGVRPYVEEWRACAMKYATALSPDIMHAKGRMKKSMNHRTGTRAFDRAVGGHIRRAAAAANQHGERQGNESEQAIEIAAPHPTSLLDRQRRARSAPTI